MKNIYLLAMICIAFTSCSKDDSPIETATTTNKKIETFDFLSYEKMDEKIDEISLMKAEIEKSTSEKYTKSSNSYNNENDSENAILEDLKNYHNDRLSGIYALRKQLNFTSIQSIADEINSLKLTNPIKSDELFKKYENLLVQDKFGVKTVFENRTAEVINDKGEVFVKGKIENFKLDIPKNETHKYLYDEYVKTGAAAGSDDFYFVVYYFTGREKHKDDFGRTFFRYFTEFKSYYTNLQTGVNTLCYANYVVDSSSIAGFSQTGSDPLSDFAFSMQYPSGSGSTIRNTGSQKWTAYQTEGGSIKGTFSTNFGGRYRVATCDFKYTR